MSEVKKRAPNGSLWGDFDESARIARESTEEARTAREAKTSRLRAMRLKHAAAELVALSKASGGSLYPLD